MRRRRVGGWQVRVAEPTAGPRTMGLQEMLGQEAELLKRCAVLHQGFFVRERAAWPSACACADCAWQHAVWVSK